MKPSHLNGFRPANNMENFFNSYFYLSKLNKEVQAYRQIQQKLHGFIRKYYTNELIKGSILFLAFGLLYFLFTLFIEYFLWLKPAARTVLFWLFIAVEITLLVKYILFPVFKLIGFAKGLNLAEASKIIGTHFNEIDDKLLNMLQLHDSSVHSDTSQESSELLLASIDQKAKDLQPIPFKKAIQFSTNKKYLNYLAIPVIIWIITVFIGKKALLQDSYTRVINHQQTYIPPAPFTFEITNKKLDVIEGESIQLKIRTKGDIIPEEAKIFLDNEYYFLKNEGIGLFSYTLEQVTKPLDFHIQANNIYSRNYRINIIPTPKIQEINLFLNYPDYIKKNNELIKNTGNVIVPVGTQITWDISTRQTDSLHLVKEEKRYAFVNRQNDFKLSKTVFQSFSYTLQASNKHLKNYENLSFTIEVIQDDYPSMSIKTDIDSISRGDAQFVGRLSDDYGISKLHLVYNDIQNKENKTTHSISINKSTIVDFYYVFPKGITVIDGVDYEFYFEAFDNDLVSGPKSVKSKTYSYHKDTQTEEEEKRLQEQKQGLDNLQKTLEKQEQNQLDLEDLQKALQNKAEIEFNDTKKLEKFIKRQEEYQQMMERQTEELERNLEEQPQLKNELLEHKKEDIKKRLQEAKDLAKQEKLVDELRKLAEKMQKEDLLDRIKKMSKNNLQQEKSLEQLLELTKRFYVEQKAEQIREKLIELAKKQEELAQAKDNSAEKQKKLNQAFEHIQKDMEELLKDNKQLREPMDIDEQKPEQESIRQDQQQATEQLQQQQPQEAGKNQKSAAKKMHEMAQTMQMQMMSSSQEMIEEDIAMLRQIIENLINFSYKQEDLMNTLGEIHKNHPGFSEKLKEQNQLKHFFEHIDDSLYVLSMRQAKLSKHINIYLANAHYYLDETLEKLEEFKIQKAVSDQHYVMTAANDLALLLSKLLDNMQSSMGMGQGKGKGMGMGKGKGSGKGFSLPDIIKKQGELSEKMEKGKKDGEKNKGKTGKPGKSGKEGKKGEQGNESNGEQSSQELYEIYKQQALLRQTLENQLNDLQGNGLKSQANNVIKQMEDLERLLLERGMTQQVLDKMLRIDHELLKLKDAVQKQGKENKRESKTNYQNYYNGSPKQLEFKNKYYRQNEILNREVLPFRSLYKKKVQEYFNTEQLKKQK